MHPVKQNIAALGRRIKAISLSPGKMRKDLNKIKKRLRRRGAEVSS
jgi:hypothetical protein